MGKTGPLIASCKTAMLLCWMAGATGIGAIPATAATYVYDHNISLPFLGFTYDDRKNHFQQASTAMIDAQFEGGNEYGFRRRNGQDYSKALDLKALPFWIYAQYRDAGSKCQYDYIDGLRPDPVLPLPDAGGIPVQSDPAAAAIVRNCGSGFELVSREGYDGALFGGPEPFASHLKGNQTIGDIGAIKRGLMHDFVQRALNAFGGKAALQARLDAAQQPHAVAAPMATSLAAAGIRIK